MIEKRREGGEWPISISLKLTGWDKASPKTKELTMTKPWTYQVQQPPGNATWVKSFANVEQTSFWLFCLL